MKGLPLVELPSEQESSYPQGQPCGIFLIELQCFIDEISVVAVHLHHASHKSVPLQRLVRQLQVFEVVCASAQLHRSGNELASLQYWLHSAATGANCLPPNPLPIVSKIERDLRVWFEEQQQRCQLVPPEKQQDDMVQEVFLREARALLFQLTSSLTQLHQLPDDSVSLQNHLRAMHTLKGSAGMANALLLTHHLHDVEAQIAEMRADSLAASDVVSEITFRHDFTCRLIEAFSVALPLTWGQGDAPETPKKPIQDLTSNPGLTPKLIELGAAIPAAQHVLAQGVEVFHGHLQSLMKEISVPSLLLETSDSPSALDQPMRSDQVLGSTEKSDHQSMHLAVEQSVKSLQKLRCKLSNAATQMKQDLTTQTVLVHQMERELLLSGMVRFSEMQVRLQQLVQYLVRETGKSLVLQLTGGETYVEQALLQKLAAPLEHLLRNAAVHGIELPQQRVAQGKPLTGVLHLDIRQCGCELRINLSDDGKGLDLSRIRAVSIEKGWFDPAQGMSSEALAELIFHPGFSTSAELTMLAGRGVGLDVVRTAVRALDGEVTVKTRCSIGTTFCMRLPQSAALTSVLMMQLEGQSYAIDSSLVKQILPVAIEDRDDLLHRGHLFWHGSRLELHSLSTVLGASSPSTKEEMNILVLKEAPITRALVVERILACREVVVRSCHLPAQQCRGFTGMSLLVDGTVTLIVDPVQLISQACGSGECSGCDWT